MNYRPDPVPDDVPRYESALTRALANVRVAKRGAANSELVTDTVPETYPFSATVSDPEFAAVLAEDEEVRAVAQAIAPRQWRVNVDKARRAIAALDAHRSGK